MEKVSNENLINPVQKRGRGRPRKNQIINETEKNKKNKNTNEPKIILKDTKKDDDEIILHLPISLKDIATFHENTIFEKGKGQITDTSNENNTNIFTINDINSDTNSENSD